MGINSTPTGERTRISIFGLRNAGKSCLINALTGQKVSLVSDVAGTTTDPVSKSMEILPIGPVIITDTPGLDDYGVLGEKRTAAALKILEKTDIALLAVDLRLGPGPEDDEIKKLVIEKGIPFITVYTKADISGRGLESADDSDLESMNKDPGSHVVSAKTGQGISELREKLGTMKPVSENKNILDGFVEEGNTVILVTPIDESAPKGRLILPQQQVLRACLDAHCRTVVCQIEELAHTLDMLKNSPDVVITDSQVFKAVNDILPPEIPLTSFSIMFAAYKGELATFIEGAKAIKNLTDGDRVLISEACTHHRQCNDIGTVKIPGWIRKYTGVNPEFEFSSGGEFPDDLSPFAVVIHCGGCMISGREMQHRMETATESGTPIVNYGIAIAFMNGVLDRILHFE